MKKTSLLSLLTAAAIVATSAGTYAVWDVTTAKSEAITLSYEKPVILSFGTVVAPSGKLGEDTSSVTADIPVKVNEVPTNGATINFKTVDASGNDLTIPNGLSIEYKKDDGTTSAQGTEVVVDETYKAVITLDKNNADPGIVQKFTTFYVQVSMTKNKI